MLCSLVTFCEAAVTDEPGTENDVPSGISDIVIPLRSKGAMETDSLSSGFYSSLCLVSKETWECNPIIDVYPPSIPSFIVAASLCICLGQLLVS